MEVEGIERVGKLGKEVDVCHLQEGGLAIGPILLSLECGVLFIAQLAKRQRAEDGGFV